MLGYVPAEYAKNIALYITYLIIWFVNHENYQQATQKKSDLHSLHHFHVHISLL